MEINEEWEVRERLISNEVIKDGPRAGKKKGTMPGKLIDYYAHKGMLAPGMTIKVKGKNRRIVCIDITSNERIAIVERIR
jgi:hypothetical protein